MTLETTIPIDFTTTTSAISRYPTNNVMSALPSNMTIPPMVDPTTTPGFFQGILNWLNTSPFYWALLALAIIMLVQIFSNYRYGQSKVGKWMSVVMLVVSLLAIDIGFSVPFAIVFAILSLNFIVQAFKFVDEESEEEETPQPIIQPKQVPTQPIKQGSQYVFGGFSPPSIGLGLNI